jgi:hypothetical protein
MSHTLWDPVQFCLGSYKDHAALVHHGLPHHRLIPNRLRVCRHIHHHWAHPAAIAWCLGPVGLEKVIVENCLLLKRSNIWTVLSN